MLILAVLAILIFLSKFSPPQILSASVYPEKVMPGQAMLIRVEIKDSLIIKNVKASIGTDDKSDTTRLLLVDGSIRNGKYERVWIAHDTSSQKWYNITITATNLFGRTATKIIPYQDPTQSHNASEIVSGTFTGNYTFAGGDISFNRNANLGGNLNVTSGLIYGNGSQLNSLPKYSDTRFKIGSFTRDTTLATGTQAVTGVGFQPKGIIFFALEAGSAHEISWGFGDATVSEAIYDFYNYATADSYQPTASSAIYDMHSSTGYYSGAISSLDSDGFTISWIKTGSPSGTFWIDYLAFR